jgi:hypothetical protein
MEYDYLNNLETSKRVEKTMKNLIYIIPFLFLMLLIPTASAGSFNGVFKQLDSVTLPQVCDNGKQPCGWCNITTIKNPDTSIIIQNVAMTQSVSDFRYTLGAGNTSLLGVYYVNGICGNGIDIKSFTYSFKVVPSEGADNNTTTFIILGVVAVIILLLSFIMHNYIFSILSGFVFMIAGAYALINGFSSVTSQYTEMLAYVLIGLGAIIIIVSTLELVKDYSGGDGSDGGFNYEDD